LAREEGKSELRLTAELMCSKRMLKFVPVIIYSAISLAIFQGSFFLLFELGMDPATKKDEKTKRDTLSMIGLGIGETLGGIMNGKL